MTDYILIQPISSKMWLKSAHTRDGQYELRFGERAISMNPVYEAWFGALLYSGRCDVVSQSIASCLRNIVPSELELCFSKFKQEHVVEKIEYSYKDIPLFADAEPFEFSSPFHAIAITLNRSQEKELLDIVADTRIRNRLSRMETWFHQYRLRYGLDTKLKRDRQSQDIELALQFCYIHGLDPDELKKQPVADSPPILSYKERGVNIILTIVGVLVYILIAVLVIRLGQSIHNMISSAIIMLCGVAMITVPVVLMFKRK